MQKVLSAKPLSKNKYEPGVTKKPKWHQKHTTIEDAQIIFFKSAEKAMERSESPPSSVAATSAKNLSEKEEGEKALFGRYIALEIDQLPKKFQKVARHEINNVMYSVQNRAGYPVPPYHSAPSHELQYQVFGEQRQQPSNSFLHQPTQQLPLQHQNIQLMSKRSRPLQHTNHSHSSYSPQYHNVVNNVPHQHTQASHSQEQQPPINLPNPLSSPREISELKPPKG